MLNKINESCYVFKIKGIRLSVSLLLLTFIAFAFQQNPTIAQTLSNSVWISVGENDIVVESERRIIPQKYVTYELDLNSLYEFFEIVPSEQNIFVSRSDAVISLPDPDGNYQKFKIVNSSVMAIGLAERYPEIRTFLGKGITNETAVLRCDITPAGFHAMVISPKGSFFIDPYSKGNVFNYIVYYTKDFIPNAPKVFEPCNVYDDQGLSKEMMDEIRNGNNVLSGDELKTYRLAVAATGEYTAYHSLTEPTVAEGLAAVVTSVNRVTAVYELEVAIRLELIENNDLIIYTDGTKDPYTNNNGSAMLGENQSNLDVTIGDGNYDIGHVFSTNGGGIAQLRVPCKTGSKARGVTGTNSPVGDPFDIDYVAHEMGHQFGGNHTFNNSCSGNRNASTAYEPGSGSTIMAYAGVCSPNLQNHSDPYFHGISFDEIRFYVTVLDGAGCPVVTATGNSAPTADAGAGGYIIPKDTPFILVGSGSDPDKSDFLTYCWEEFDLGPAGHPNSPVGNAPIFRSFNPVEESFRIFPKLFDILNNTQTLGEKLPANGRDLTFRLTVRDNFAGGGGVDFDQIALTVDDNAGPFVVIYPNNSVDLDYKVDHEVTWDVSDTEKDPINCSFVNILLSIDGGYNFDHVLASNTINDGSEIITLPMVITTTARIKIEAVDNVFFDISNEDFTIDDLVPVELTSFTGEVVADDILIRWFTATETNNSGFELIRNSEPIAFIDGNGTTTRQKSYFFLDENLPSGNYEYNLIQIDYDGTRTNVGSFLSNVSIPNQFSISQNYPNPFNPSTIINFTIPEAGLVTITLYNSMGEKITDLIKKEMEAGNHNYEFNADLLEIEITSGIYFYSLTAGNNKKSLKMILLK